MASFPQPGRERVGPWGGRGGFTLVELILVMTLLAVILSLAAPSLSKFFHGRTLDSESRRFLALTRYGQSRAVSEGTPMVLWTDPKTRTYGLEQESSYSVIDDKIQEFKLDENLTLELTDVPRQTGATGAGSRAGRAGLAIRFLPDGFVSETSPQSVIIEEEKVGRVWLALSTNRLAYAIQTNDYRVRRQ